MTFDITAVRDIGRDEEITINYNDYFDAHGDMEFLACIEETLQ